MLFFFSACYKFAIQAKKNKHPDSANDVEVPWLYIVPKLGLPPDPVLFTSTALFLILKRCGIASFPTLPRLHYHVSLWVEQRRMDIACSTQKTQGLHPAQEAASAPGL